MKMPNRKSALGCMLIVATVMLTGCGGGSTRSQTPAQDLSATSSIVEVAYQVDDAEIPTIAVDERNGAVYVAYFTSTSDIHLVRRPSPDSAWGDPVRVNSEPGDARPHAQAPAQVAVDPDGTVYVVWSNAIPVAGRRFDASNLFIARSSDGGRTFSPQRTINSDAHGPPAGHTFHDVAVANDGTLYVSWLDSRDDANMHGASDAHDTETMATSNDADHIHVAGDAHDTAAMSASKESEHMHGASVRVASSRDFGRTFIEGTVVARDVCPCCRTSLAVAADGTVHVAWRGIYRDSPTGEQRDITFASSRDGGLTFTTPRRVHDDAWHFNGCPHAGPSLAVDSDGGLHAAWFTGGGEAPGLYYAVAGPDGEFGPPAALVTGVGVSQVQIASGAQSGVWIAWEDQADGSVRIAHIDDDGSLVRVARREGMLLPAVAAAPGGFLLAAQGSDRGQDPLTGAKAVSVIELGRR